MMWVIFSVTCSGGQLIQFSVKVYKEATQPLLPPAVYWDDPALMETISLMEIVVSSMSVAVAIVQIICFIVVKCGGRHSCSASIEAVGNDNAGSDMPSGEYHMK